VVRIFHRAESAQTKPLKALPQAARTAGIVSLVVWLIVAACGRTIAYF
jgi:hypothetical protein